MKYVIFVGYAYYPSGGAYDYYGSADNLADVLETPGRAEKEYDWAHFYNTTTKMMYWRGDDGQSHGEPSRQHV